MQKLPVRTTEYVVKGGRRLRCGFTTGSCAAAAAAAAVQMLLTGERVTEAEIRTPGGPVFHAQILEPEMRFHEGTGHTKGRNSAGGPERGQEGRPLPISCRCAVRKDGGDDPDITTGTLIEAEAFLMEDEAEASPAKKAQVTESEAGPARKAPAILIEGGRGIGRVTKPGLDRPVGEAAINRVPLQMIEENVRRVLAAHGKGREIAALRIVISAPEGEKLAEKTFNPRLGIVGGISILGTTGIVEPMSDSAVVETIRTQMRVRRAAGDRYVVAAPGNYGLDFLTGKYGVDGEQVVLISNFVREAAQMAAEEGFEGIVLAGHIGKLVKVAGGAGNTHSQYGDRRMEILQEIASKYCRPGDTERLAGEIAECVMTDAALEVLDRYGVREETAQEMARRICAYLEEWSGGRLRAETIIFSNRDRELQRSAGAEGILRERNERREE